MASARPILKQTAWLSLVPQAVIFVLLVLGARRLGAGDPVFAAAIVYLVALFSLRWLVAFHHRKGIRRFKRGRYERAIGEFRKSYDFFTRHPWIDRFRYVTLLSSSRVSYREMALVNIAFCHGQIGAGREAREYYERALAEFPDSELAKAALRMMESAQTSA